MQQITQYQEIGAFHNDKVFSDGCAVAFFYTDKPMANVYTGAYHETTNSGVITKIEGKRTLVEIDGVPAMKNMQNGQVKN